MKSLRVEDVAAIHAFVIRETGGLDGVRDLGSVASAVGRVQAGHLDGEFFPTVHDKAGALLEAIVHNHGFIDGNKRTALAAAAELLGRNGFELDYETAEAVDFMLAVATHRVQLPDIIRWLREHSEGV